MGISSFRIAFVTFVSVVAIAAGVLTYLIFTTQGSLFLSKFVLSYFLGSNHFLIADVNGDLARGLTFREVEIKNIAGFPEGTSLKAQSVVVSLRPFIFDSFNLNIENARLALPFSEPILLFANYKDVKLNANIYSRRIDAEDILNLFLNSQQLKEVSGSITNFESYVKGSFTRPQLTGVFELEKFNLKNITLNDCPGSFAFKPSSRNEKRGLEGAVIFKSGELKVRDRIVSIQEATVLFSPDKPEPAIKFRGVTVAKGIMVRIRLAGNISSPQLTLSSDTDAWPRELAYLLLTGKIIAQDQRQQLSKEALEPELSKALLGFILNGEGGVKELLEKLGVSEYPLLISEKEALPPSDMPAPVKDNPLKLSTDSKDRL